ncbi:hypothetical protein HYH02_004433 [Chlamydomonas schloesseri]|uniref:Rab-GAP TBC domain-containing protein n=1 Tax=Chlamydomonas schloesseri TaxID=2026947 RepID=A0A836B8F3_9CHLO|nr:hypothetical protein HYH02_004433 [Chlamydomonas schloesseri]|eukprot:KAG2450593.1 hypothetical protein HYH02_004433 [Chlamydomonas schloesseri]
MDAERISHDGQLLQGASRPAGIDRLRRILTAYALTDSEVGYCQGMTDLCAPLLEVYPRDDQQAFDAFCGLMGRVRANFLGGMADMRRQLGLLGEVLGRLDARLHRHLVVIGAGSYVFAFQMLLLQLRREVAWADVFVLWETMWAREARLAAASGLPPAAAGRGAAVAETSQAQPPLQPQQQQQHQQYQELVPPPLQGAVRVDLRVFVVAAALLGQRAALLSCASMEEVVQFANHFPQPTNVVALVDQAERLFLKFGRLQRQRNGGSLSGCLRGGCTSSNGVELAAEEPMAAAFAGALPAQAQPGVTADGGDEHGAS